jgi:hypothetical protein
MDWHYTVRFNCYCGMSIPLGEDVTAGRAHAIVTSYNRRAQRSGITVERLMGRGRPEWEHSDEDAALIGDDQGILVVTRSRLTAGERSRRVMRRRN